MSQSTNVVTTIATATIANVASLGSLPVSRPRTAEVNDQGVTTSADKASSIPPLLARAARTN